MIDWAAIDRVATGPFQLGHRPGRPIKLFDDLLARTSRILNQQRKDKTSCMRCMRPKLYAPEVECIAKGKARTPYECGEKVSFVPALKVGLVVGARSMPGNPYDGHTLHEALEQAEILSQIKPVMAFVDRFYRGVEVDGVQI